MMLSRLVLLQSDLLRDPFLTEHCTSVELLFRKELGWTIMGESSSLLPDSAKLDTHLSSAECRMKGREGVWVPLPNISAVVHAVAKKRTTTNLATRIRDAVLRCVTTSSNAFDAQHDRMTGLLNAQALQIETSSAITKRGLAPESMPSSKPAGSGTPVTLFAIDIDHFKQINDTYGHLYGDLVIKVLARRLQHLISARHNTDTTCIASRPSGEEFLICLIGPIQPESDSDFAESLLRCVSQDPLPSAEESKQVDPEGSIALPPVAERRVTISIGVASADLKAADSLSSLRHKADAALYCAKSGGRNCARHFEDILDRHGLVLGRV